ncbi:hypothetical protein SOVF_006910 [Spinacia oleracea]|nr:hypothetical protein SOVF_006910 [Spinacia oleracea]
MHRYRSPQDGGDMTLDGSQYGGEEEADPGLSVFVKVNRVLHGKKAQRGRKQETLTINFLKKYIHYAKHRVQPELSDEVCPAQAIIIEAEAREDGAVGPPESKLKVIKEVRSFTELGLKEAKDLVEKTSAFVKKGVTKEEGEAIY